MNKNKKIILSLVTGVSILTLAACNNVEENNGNEKKTSNLSTDKQIEKALEQIVSAKAISADVKIDYLLKDINILKEAGMSDEEIKELERAIKQNNVDLKFAVTEDIVEMIITLDSALLMNEITGKTDSESKEIDIPIVIDVKNEKTYIGTDWFIDFVDIMLLATADSLDGDSKNAFNDALKEFNKFKEDNKKGKLLDLSAVNEDSLFAGQEEVFIDSIPFKSLLEKESVDTKFIVEFLKDISKDAYVLNDDKSVTLNIPKDKVKSFEENIGFIESANLDTGGEYDNDLDKFTAGLHDSIENVKIKTTLNNKEKLIGFEFQTDNVLDKYKATETVVFNNLKLNDNIKTIYNLDKLDLMTAEEETELTENITNFLLLAMFGSMSFVDEDESLDEE